MAQERTLKLTILGNAKSALKALDRTQGRLGKFGGALKKASKVVAGFGLALGAAFAGAAAVSVKKFAEMGDQVQKMALRTGFSTEALSELRYAADLSGASLETLEKGVRTMQRAIFDAGRGLSTQVDALTALGLTYDDLKGKAPEDQFDILTTAIAGVANESDRAALAQMLFGRAGTQMLPMLAAGAAGLAGMRKEARELGIVFSQEDADAAAEFNDMLTRLGARLDAVKFTIARAVIPVLMRLGEWLGPKLTEASNLAREKLVQFGDWFQENRAAIEGFFNNVRGAAKQMFDYFLDGLGTVGPVLARFGKWIVDNKPVLIAAMVAIGIAIVTALGPVSLTVLAIAGVITLIGLLKDKWTIVANAVISAIEWMANMALKGMTALARNFLRPLQVIIDGLNHIPKVNIPSVLDGFDNLTEGAELRLGRFTAAVETATSAAAVDLGQMSDMMADAAAGMAPLTAAADTLSGSLGGGPTSTGPSLADGADIATKSIDKMGEAASTALPRLSALADAVRGAFAQRNQELGNIAGMMPAGTQLSGDFIRRWLAAQTGIIQGDIASGKLGGGGVTVNINGSVLGDPEAIADATADAYARLADQGRLPAGA